MKNSAKHKVCLVYMAVNVHNGHSYIGITTHRYVSRRESEHVSSAQRHAHNGRFYRAIRKYGRDAFEWFELARFDTAVAALKKEIELISLWRPEYNSTKGGEHPAPQSPEALEKRRAKLRGRPIRVGPHSEKTKAILRLRAIQQWKEGRGVSHPLNTNGKKVVRLDDGMVFLSASEAARKLCLSKSQIIMNCRRQVATVGGFVFRYFGDHQGGPQEAEIIRAKRRGTVENRPIICLNDLIVYPTNNAATKAYPVSKNTVFRCCERGGQRTTVSGLSFCYLDEWCPNPL